MHVTPPGQVLDRDVARVIVPFTRLAAETIWALQETGHDWEAVSVSDSPSAYFELFERLWTRGETFALVEHDIVPRPELLDDFDRCPHEWCVAKYPYLRGTYWGLGCVRFRAELMARLPDLPAEVGQYETPGHPPKFWCVLDQAVTTTLRAHHVEWPHEHGTVEHLGDHMPSHGCRA